MGIGGISIWQLLIILAIVVLLFGTKRLKGIGGDLGSAIKGFKKAVAEDEPEQKPAGQQAKVEHAATESVPSAEQEKKHTSQ